jgi:glycosyltransferase involved in cell wall biosynthesis
MYHNKKISVVIPTYNESQSIRGVIEGFFETRVVDEIIAVDNNALGNTEEEIKKTKAVYIKESEKQGYGFALMRGMNEATGDIVVMCEADGTFLPKDIEKLLSYSDEFDAVLGTRTSRSAIWSGAFMPFPVRFANWLWAKFLEILFNGPVLTDVGCTYKLVSREALEKIKPLFSMSKGDGRFSPELMIWLIKKKVNLIEVPVIFKERIGQSMYTGSVWRAAKLGIKMLPLIARYKFIKIKFL